MELKKIPYDLTVCKVADASAFDSPGAAIGSAPSAKFDARRKPAKDASASEIQAKMSIG